MLLEVLVAVVVAGLVLSAVGAALAQGWRNTGISLDVLSAVTLARTDLQRRPGDLGPPTMPPGFSLSRRATAVTIIARPSPVAPPPHEVTPTAGARGSGPRANDVMPGVTHLSGGPSGRLESLVVTVRTPARRSITLETVRLDAAPN